MFGIKTAARTVPLMAPVLSSILAGCGGGKTQPMSDEAAAPQAASQQQAPGSKYVIRIFSKSASKVLGINQPDNTSNRWDDDSVLLKEGRDLGIRYDGP